MYVCIYLFELLLVDLQCCEDWFQWSFSPALLITTPVYYHLTMTLGKTPCVPHNCWASKQRPGMASIAQPQTDPSSFAVGEELKNKVFASSLADPQAPERSGCPRPQLAQSLGRAGLYCVLPGLWPGWSAFNPLPLVPRGVPEADRAPPTPPCPGGGPAVPSAARWLSPSPSELGGAGVRWGSFLSAVPSREGRWGPSPCRAPPVTLTPRREDGGPGVGPRLACAHVRGLLCLETGLLVPLPWVSICYGSGLEAGSLPRSPHGPVRAE